MADSKMAEPLFRRILFPVDFSANSEKAAPYVLALARQNGAKLYVLHVVNVTEEASGFYVPHLSFKKLEEEEEKAEEKTLKVFCARNLDAYEDLEWAVTTGEPCKEILRAAEEKDVDVIVMASGSREAVDHIVFGSTAEKVVKGSKVPVLLIPRVL